MALSLLVFLGIVLVLTFYSQEQELIALGYSRVCVVVVALTPALGRQGQVDLCKFEASLVYKASFRTTKAPINPISKNQRERGREKGGGRERKKERE